MRLILLFFAISLMTIVSMQASERPKVLNYSDVPITHWAADAIRDLQGTRIPIGHAHTNFDGEKLVRRVDVAVYVGGILEELQRRESSQVAFTRIHQSMQTRIKEAESLRVRISAIEGMRAEVARVLGSRENSWRRRR